jgi:hypothetical protein
MANMSYCRNENTYHDMVDCIQNFDLVAGNQRDESYRKRLLSLIIDYVESGEAHEALLAEDIEN